MNRILFIVAILIFCVGIGFSNAELYKWVDKDGVEHVSDYESDVPPGTPVETAPEVAYDPAADAKRKAQDKKTMEAVDQEEDQMISETKKQDEQAAQSEKPAAPSTQAPTVIIDDNDEEYWDEHEARREKELHDTNRLNETVGEDHPNVRYEHDMHRNEAR